MYILFLDESGKPSDNCSRSAAWRCAPTVGRAAGAVAGGAGRPQLAPRPRGEVARHPHRRGAPTAGRRAVRRRRRRPVTCFVTVLRPLAGRKREEAFFATDEDTYATALTFLAERYQRWLADRDSFGMMVVDSRREVRRADAALLRAAAPRGDALRPAGADRRCAVPRAVALLDRAAGGRSGGGSTLAAQRGQLGDASRWHKQLLPRFARHPATGEVEGVGLKRYPAGGRVARSRRQAVHGVTAQQGSSGALVEPAAFQLDKSA